MPYCVDMVLVVKRFCVSMVVCFIAAISVACLSACSVSCFCVVAVNTAKRLFIFIFSVSSLCLLDHLYWLSGKGDVCSSSSSAGAVSSLFGSD
jgi:hypothetical protein